MQTRRPLHAFTLIELLVVIAIIALLLSVMVPSLRKAKEVARRIVCQSNTRALSMGWNAYAVANQGKFFSLCPGWKGGAQQLDYKYSWIHQDPAWGRPPYYTEENWQQCIEQGVLYDYLGGASEKLYRCPAGKEAFKVTYSGFPSVGWLEPIANDSRFGEVFKNLNQIKQSSTRALFIDEGYLSTDFYAVYNDRDMWFDQPPGRHGLGTVLSFVDGHCEYWAWENAETQILCQLSYADFYESTTYNNLKDLTSGAKTDDLYRLRVASWGHPGPQP